MNSLRRWLYRPKRSDTSLLAQFFYADEDLNMVAAELDSFDGRKDPERCTALVNQLRSCQDKVLTAIQNIMDDGIPGRRASRDFRCKFPDDVIQENLAGQLWFGAECLAAGSSIMNREAESASMRPLARALTKNLDSLRTVLREQCLKNINEYTDRIKEALIIFDKLFAEFELSYVGAMVPVKTMKEYDTIQEITVLFSETVQRALRIGLLTQDMIDEYDPALMFTIPRLAIVSGLVVFREGPLNPDNDPWNMSDMFRPFQTLLFKIRELLYTLSPEEMLTLERALCSAEEPTFLASLQPSLESVEGFSQTDFVPLNGEKHDSSAASSYQDQLGGPIIVHTPDSGSPVTPVAQTEFPCSMSTSTSCATVIADSRQNSIDTDRADGLECRLNKSESNDSGLHSENVSTSESITTVSSTESQHHEGVLDNTVIPGSSTFEDVAELTGMTEADDSAVAGNAEIGEADVSRSITKMCEDIVTEIVNTTITDSSAVTSPSVSTCVSSSVSPSVSRSHSSMSSRPVGDGSDDSSDSVSILSDTVNPSEIVCDLPNQDSILDTSSAIEQSPEHRPQTLQTWDPPAIDTLQEVRDSLQDVRESLQNARESFHDVSSQTDTTRATRSNSSHSASTSKKRDKKTDVNGAAIEKLLARSGASCSEAADRSERKFPSVHRLRYEDSLSSSCSSCKSSSIHGDADWERGSCASSETSSYNSECQDDEEIALAIQAAELASRNEARSRFRSSSDMIHRLFVCISGVADQLQTNFASDLRNILRAVFDMNCGEPLIVADNKMDEDEEEGASSSNENSPTRSRGIVEPQEAEETNEVNEANNEVVSNHGNEESNERSSQAQDPPNWIPDELSPLCMACRIPFTFVRRRHHCRNCGKIFCGRCSSNSVPLPHYGHAKPVRVCNRCFMFQVTPFTVAPTS